MKHDIAIKLYERATELREAINLLKDDKPAI